MCRAVVLLIKPIVFDNDVVVVVVVKVSNTLPKSNKRNVELNKICIWKPMTTGFIM